MSNGDRWTGGVNPMREIAHALGGIEGIAVPVSRVQKQRRDYTARELREMADNAAKGIPPATSPARGMIERAQLSGDFERANALIAEVKEKAPALARLARAAEKAERRAKRRHVHKCNRPEDASGHSVCRCVCGATSFNTMGEAEWSKP